LKNDVQSYKDDNERIMKSKEQQDSFNIKLMQILDIIENKMQKETESSMSSMSHDERRKTRSVNRNHHHSPNNSFRKARNSLSPYHVRNHKRRIGVDEIKEEINKIKPPTFDGEHKCYNSKWHYHASLLLAYLFTDLPRFFDGVLLKKGFWMVYMP
jgi:hypothetical protein